MTLFYVQEIETVGEDSDDWTEVYASDRNRAVVEWAEEHDPDCDYEICGGHDSMVMVMCQDEIRTLHVVSGETVPHYRSVAADVTRLSLDISYFKAVHYCSFDPRMARTASVIANPLYTDRQRSARARTALAILKFAGLVTAEQVRDARSGMLQ